MMRHRYGLRSFALIALAAAIFAPRHAASAQTPVVIPTSPVGALLKQWVDVFNAADSAGLAAFYAAHLPRVTAQGSLQLARNSHGLDIVRIISADQSHIVFAARARNATSLRGNIRSEERRVGK